MLLRSRLIHSFSLVLRLAPRFCPVLGSDWTQVFSTGLRVFGAVFFAILYRSISCKSPAASAGLTNELRPRRESQAKIRRYFALVIAV